MTPPVGDGLLVVDKPGGLTSHDVVARVRRLAGTRRVGHAGTLDPMATGVLVVGIGRATRLLGHLSGTRKTYEATIRLGSATTTDDAEGEVVSRTPADDLDPERVRLATAGLVGELDQVPAAVSAVKVAGERAYARVRRGEQVTLEPRRVHVHSFDVLASRPVGDHTDLDVRVVCSSGTYVRALARDLGAALGVGGHLTRLRRTAVGPFGEEQARTLEQLAEHLDLVDLTAAVSGVFAVLRLDDEQSRLVRHGSRLAGLTLPDDAAPVAVLDETGTFLALYAQRGPDAVPVAVFCG